MWIAPPTPLQGVCWCNTDLYRHGTHCQGRVGEVQHNPTWLAKRSVVWICLIQCVSLCVNKDVEHVAVGAICLDLVLIGFVSGVLEWSKPTPESIIFSSPELLWDGL